MDNFNLSDEQKDVLARYEELINSDDRELNIMTLASLDWDLTRAVESHLADESRDNDIEMIGEVERQPLGTIYRDPVVEVVEQPVRPTVDVATSSGHSNGRAAAGSVHDEEDMMVEDDDDSIDVIDDYEEEPLQGSADVPLIPTDVESVQEALHNFVTVFQARFINSASTIMPSFYTGSLPEAIKEAFEAPNRGIEERRPLALYIHSDRSICANIFPSTVLCKETISNLLRLQYVLWPWDVTYKENEEKFRDWLAVLNLTELRQMYDLNTRNKEKLPLLVVVTREKGQYRVVDCCYGHDTPEAVLEKLMSGIDAYTDIRMMESHEQRDRIEREQIRQEQAQEYEASLAADRAKKEAKDREIQAQKEEEQKKIQDAENQAIKMAQLESELPSEPAEGDANAIMVKFRLPNDDQCVRRFRKEETLAVLHKFLASKGYDPAEYRFINSDFPKKDVSGWDASKTFTDLKWPVREQIFVEEQ